MTRVVRHLLLVVIFLICLTAPLDAAPARVTFQWPPNLTGGYYEIRGPGKQDTTGRLKETRVANLAEGSYRINGAGFTTVFAVRDGEVDFQSSPMCGVQLDRQTRTFHFLPVTITLDGNGADLPIAINGVTESLPPSAAKTQITLIHGPDHRLMTPAGTWSMAVDSRGQISLPGAPGGWNAGGSLLKLEPKAFSIEPGDQDFAWELRGIRPLRTGAAVMRLLPSENGYLLEFMAGKRKSNMRFFIGPDYRLSPDGKLDWMPFVDLARAPGRGEAQGTIRFTVRPEGFDRAAWQVAETDRQRREAAEKARKAAYRKIVLQAAATAPWSHEFVLTDFTRLFDFPEELLRYPLEFPLGKVRPAELSLSYVDEERGMPVVFQLGDVLEEQGFLRRATIAFRADLPRGGTRRFILTAGAKNLMAPPAARVAVIEKRQHEAVLAGNLLRARVPFGHRDFQPPLALAQAPAPVLGVARTATPQAWQVAGSFQAPPHLLVMSMAAGPLEEGPLRCVYRVAYRLAGGRRYTVDLTLQHNENYLGIDERLEGFRSADNADLRVDFKGVNPDRRQVMSNGGYQSIHGSIGHPFSGSFDDLLEAGGKLPYELGLNMPNSLGVMRATAFWNDQGSDALLLAIDRLRDWRTERRQVWHQSRGPGNLNFYSSGPRKYLLTRLEGQRRLWALALIPREEMLNRPHLPDKRFQKQVAGPEIRLWQKLGDFSLNRRKDWIFEWDEPLGCRLYTDADKVTYEEWVKRNSIEGANAFLSNIINCYWDVSGPCGAVSFRDMPRWFGMYERSRADWTEAQRKHVRAILLFMAYSSEDDNNLPHHSMLAGHPNFISDVKLTLPIACAVFPTHPHARQWRDSFLEYYREWLATYQRQPDASCGAIGGRWTENIACYSGQALKGALEAAVAMRVYDGSDLLNQPGIRAWVRWYLEAMMAPQDGVRLVPPEGAHAVAFEPGRKHSFHDVLFEVARQIRSTAPELSAQMAWVESNGRQGARPSLHSLLVRDYGPVFRYDFGGPHEAYAHFLQIAGNFNYRWGEGNGTLYYAAGNKVWSSNTQEGNGDEFDINRITAFSVNGRGLGRHATDQPLLDFDFAQFYRALADPAEVRQTGYLSRGLLLLGDECLLVFDHVAQRETAGQFAWINAGELPEIYQLQPGASPQDSSFTEMNSRDPSFRRPFRIRRYQGQGDFLTLVAPRPIDVKATPYGALLRGNEYVFMTASPRRYADENVAFAGTVGYARPGYLALLEGDRLRLGTLEVAHRGGDFGVALTLEGKQIHGWFAGRSGGTVRVVPPAGLDAARAQVMVDGAVATAAAQEAAIEFTVQISQAQGRKRFEIRFP